MNLYKVKLSSEHIILEDILRCIYEDISNYKFSIFEFDGVMKESSCINTNVISRDALSNSSGYRLGIIDIYDLAKNIAQTYDLILAGGSTYPVEFIDNDNWRKENCIVIEMLDCGDWVISTTNQILINKVEKLSCI